MLKGRWRPGRLDSRRATLLPERDWLTLIPERDWLTLIPERDWPTLIPERDWPTRPSYVETEIIIALRRGN